MKVWVKNIVTVFAGVALAAVAVFHDRADRDRAWLRMTLGEPRFAFLQPAAQWLRQAGPSLEHLGLIGAAETDVEPGIRMRLDPWDRVDRTILATGSWEPGSWAAIEGHLPAGGTFVDVGAHVGYYSIKAARRVGPGGRVIAIEPNPETLVRLRRNLALSRVETVVSVQPVACFETPSRLTLFLSPRANTGESSLSRENASQEGAARAVVVDALPLDDILKAAGVSHVHVIKMDIEGAELGALRGAVQTLARHRPALLLEVDDHHLRNMGTSETELRAFLEAAGYAPGSRFGQNMTWTPRK